MFSDRVSLDLVLVLVHQGLDSSAVVRVNSEHFEVFFHTGFGQLVQSVELLPELVFKRLSAVVVELDVVEAKSAHNSFSRLEAFIVSKVLELSVLSEDPDVDAGRALHTNE